MEIYDYWSKESICCNDSNGEPKIVECWGWSNESEADAYTKAKERCGRVAKMWEQSNNLSGHSYPYPNHPIKEHIIEKRGTSPSEQMIITRNHYGALVLNTSNVMFIDIDFHGLNFREMLAKLFKGKTETDLYIDRLRKLTIAFPDISVRVYRTHSGLRGIVTHQPITPNAEISDRILSLSDADPLYANLCKKQKCYRARLTPKFWRCDIDESPNCPFPWPNTESEHAFHDWLRMYDEKRHQYRTCEYVTTLGKEKTCREAEEVIALHDRETGVRNSLPLA